MIETKYLLMIVGLTAQNAENVRLQDAKPSDNSKFYLKENYYTYDALYFVLVFFLASIL